MTPGKNSPRSEHWSDDVCIVPSSALSRMQHALTVTHAYVQILQRRVSRGTPIDPDDLARVLTEMEQATQGMKGELRALEMKGIGPQRARDQA